MGCHPPRLGRVRKDQRRGLGTDHQGAIFVARSQSLVQFSSVIHQALLLPSGLGQ